MSSSKNPGRVAGFLYLLLALAGPIRLIYIPSKLFVTGDAAATARNIAAHETLFRLGMLTDLIGATVAIFLALALYRLFKGVDRHLAALVVILGSLMVTPIYFTNVVNDAGALLLARGGDFLSVLDPPQREALAMLFLRLHHYNIVANEVFWGLWLFPLGLLTYRSRFLPRFLGVWLIVNCFAYLAMSFTGVMLPRYEDALGNVVFPAQLGEVAFMLWLLIGGVKQEKLSAAPPAAAMAG